MSNTKISTQPYKGARDFYPSDMQIRNYIFDGWKKVCKKFGYEEYDGPFIESFELYAAKTGEEIVNEQLYSFKDRGDRKVAIRPEMTPTLARMISQQYKTLTFPIRWFSIPNLWRYEKPQKGRLREHFQLNVDAFGINGVEADFEIISLVIEIMKQFNAPKDSFEIRVGNRRLMDDVYKSFNISQEQAYRTNKAIDKMNKISKNDFKELLKEEAKLTGEQIVSILQFLEDPKATLEKLENMSEGAREVKTLLNLFKVTKNDKFVRYDPTIMRGFDYYTGNVFELYDLHPENNRAMCGGGRYDDLVKLFIDQQIPGVGFGMGDVTFRNFLENWNLLPTLNTTTNYLVTLWPENSEKYLKVVLEVSDEMRKNNKNVVTWLESNTKMEKQLKYADKQNIKNVVIIGENELKENNITIKNMETKKQETYSMEQFLSELKQ